MIKGCVKKYRTAFPFLVVTISVVFCNLTATAPVLTGGVRKVATASVLILHIKNYCRFYQWSVAKRMG
jgi:hypothetical protein